MAGRALKVERFGLTEAAYRYLKAFRLRVEVTDPWGTGADPNVFLFLRRPPSPYDGSVLDEFQAVTSAPDLAEFPVDEPNGDTTFPIYRSNILELDLRSSALLNHVWLTLIAEIGILLEVLDRLDTLQSQQVVVLGDPPDNGGSSSSESTST